MRAEPENKATKGKDNKECISFVLPPFPSLLSDKVLLYYHYFCYCCYYCYNNTVLYYTVLQTLGWHNKHPLLPAHAYYGEHSDLCFPYMFSFWKLSFPSPGYSQTFLPSGATSSVGGIADTPDKRPNKTKGHSRLDQAAPFYLLMVTLN